jgi:competence protein ComFC
MMKKVINSFLNLLFPQKCLGCGKENELICQKCLARIDYPTLLNKNNIWAATDYNDVLAQKAIWLLKYRGLRQIAKPLAELINTRCLKIVEHRVFNTLFIPIPLSAKRFRERGYNQSELIAKFLSDNVAVNVLYKIRETDSQVSLKDKEKRLNNLLGSFGIKNPELITGKNIILIDDVSTTGATIREAKKVLLSAGAKSVSALVVARG